MELLAHRRVKAVACNRNLGARGRAILEAHRDAALFLVDPHACAAELDGVSSQSLVDDLEQRLMQIGAMDREMRPGVPGVAPASLLEDKLAVLVVPDEFLRLDAAAADAGLDAQLREAAHRMRQQIDADAERLELARRLVDAAGDAFAVQVKRGDQAADAAADQRDVHVSRGARAGASTSCKGPPRAAAARAVRRSSALRL